MHKSSSIVRLLAIALGTVLLVSIFYVQLQPTQASAPTCPNDPATQVYLLVNQYRIAHGMHPFLRDATLDTGAEATAQLFSNPAWNPNDPSDPLHGHTGPDGSTPLQRITAALGYAPFLYGENLGAGQPDAQSIYNGWLGSPSHKAQWDTPYYTWTGVGYKNIPGSTYGTYWFQWFVIKNQSEYTNPPTIPAIPNPCPSGGSNPTPTPTVTPTATPTPTPTPVTPAHITITKTVDKPTAQSGDTLTYTLVLKNTSSVSATNIKVSDVVPPSVTYIIGSAAQNGNPTYNTTTTTLTWSFSTIAAGNMQQLSFKAKVN